MAILAMITVLGVNWWLHQNGISMTADYQCGLEEHAHDDSCYTSVLTCELEETAALEGHTHSDLCYQQESVLVCTDESEEHTHDETCYETVETLTCGLEETEAVEGHIHTEACYDRQLTCGMEEHTHTAACYGSDTSADRETASVWEATLPTEEELTGVWADDLIAVAKTQLGYTESTANFLVDENGEKKGYTRYGAWYGNEYGDWCAMFAAFCLNYADVDRELVPINSGCQAWIVQLKDETIDLYRQADAYTPVPGDLIFFDWNGDGTSDHVGIVTELVYETEGDDTTPVVAIKTIEGNTADTVAERKYDLTDTTILGYCQLPENPEETITQTAETENYLVTVTYGPEAELPENALLQVTEYTADSAEYQAAAEQTGENYDWLLDISFVADGVEVEPQAEVKISVAARNGEETETAEEADTAQEAEKTITHFAESGVESVTGKASENETTFSLGSLSLVGQVEEWINVIVDTSMLSDTPVNVFSTSLAAADGEGMANSISPSGAKTETVTKIEGVEPSTITASSDKATSNIEDAFTGTKDQDGKVMTDKSVVYGDDDYEAFENYNEGTFSVTLSALEQEYTSTSTDSFTTPIDVVFVLDVSNSMRYTVGNSTRREAMVTAVNEAIDYILNANSQNRVGIALFSSKSSTLLEVNRYTGVTSRDGTTKYIELGKAIGNFANSDNNVRTVNGLRVENGNKVTQTSGGVAQRLGTYTQAGIAQGNLIFQNVQNTSFTVESTSGKIITGQRQPVLILLSDGVPTHGNDQYNNVLDTKESGNGNENEKEIEGYYTILSANYYKEQVGAKYSKTAKFYTIGEGITEIDASTRDDKVAYANAVLNPSKTVMGYLSNLDGDSVSLLKKMLTKQIQDGKQYTVGNFMYNGGSYDTDEYEYYYKAGVEKYPDYSYADGAYFGELEADDLEKAFKSIAESSSTATTYYTPLAESTGVTLTDPIGSGMEMEGAPVLRVCGNNYTGTASTSGNVTTYTYSGTVTSTVDTNRTYDLSKVKVTVTTADDGSQTVNMVIPAELMPIVRADEDGNYLKDEPIRLIYQVGLTDASKETINAADDGTTFNFYTNKWQEGSSANAAFKEDTENSYNFGNETKAKGEGNNPSGTSENYFTETENGQNVTQTLGNNGKLTIKTGPVTSVTVTKKWSSGDTHDPITVNLIRVANGEKTPVGESITLNADNGWTYTWKDLPTRSTDKRTPYTYEVQEVNVPDGYRVSYTNVPTDDEPYNWTITNTAENDVKVQVKKAWTDGFGNPITAPDTTITGTLYQVDNWQETTVDQTVTLTVQANYRTGWGSATAQTISSQTGIKSGGSYSAKVTATGNSWSGTTTRTIDNIAVDSDSAKVTVGSNNFTISNITEDTTVLITFDNALVSSAPTLSNVTYTQPSDPQTSDKSETHTFPFTLSAANSWTAYWTAADLGEKDGHTYSYYVSENKVDGYITTVSHDKDSPLTPTSDSKTITITNKEDHKDMVLPVEKQWIDVNGNVNTNAPDTTVYVVLLDKTTGDPVLGADGQAQVIALNAGNGWKGQFTVTVDTDSTDDLANTYAIGEFVTWSDSQKEGSDVIAGTLNGQTIYFSKSDLYTQDNREMYVSQVPYTVTFTTKASDDTSANVNPTTLVVKNTSVAFKIPETGGAGTTLYAAVGAGLMAAAALMYGLSLRRRRERRVE